MEYLTYGMICLMFVLIGMVGLQFTYMFYVERLYKERGRHLKLVEGRNAVLKERLRVAEQRLESLGWEEGGSEPSEEAWAEILDDN